MRKRILFAVTGAFVGVAMSAPLGDALKLGTTVAIVGCMIIGLLIGIVISTLVDVFAASADESSQG